MGRLDALESEIENLRKQNKQKALQFDQMEITFKNTINELNETKRKQQELQSQVCNFCPLKLFSFFFFYVLKNFNDQKFLLARKHERNEFETDESH